MSHLGIRERVPFPEVYKEFRMARTHGRVYGVPLFLEPDETLDRGRLLTHPATLSAATLPEMQALIDSYDGRRYEPIPQGRCDGYDLVRHDGRAYGVPRSAGPVNLNREEDRLRAGVIGGATFEEVRQRIQAAKQAAPVEFAGWLPIYEFSGNCGQHPQFTHTANPPPGYRFTHSAPARQVRQSWWQKCLSGAGQAVARAWNGVGLLLRPLRAWFGRAPAHRRARGSRP